MEDTTSYMEETTSYLDAVINNINNINGVNIVERRRAESALLEELFESRKDAANNDGRSSIPGFKETTNFDPKYYKNSSENKPKKKRLIDKLFSTLSRINMNYDGDIIKNMRALPADKSLLDTQDKMMNAGLYDSMSSSWKQKDNKDKDFQEKDFCQKREVLRNLSLQPELEEILDTMTNECIVYDANNIYFASPLIDPLELKKLTKDMQDKITKSISKSFNMLYKHLQWNRKAWDDMKRFLIEGILAWEIIYDSLEKPTSIIGMVPIDPATLTLKYKNGKKYWVQFSGLQTKERTLLDAQVVYIQFQETQSSSRLSYLERLIRPYNIYRIIEQAQILWTFNNGIYRLKYTIPVKGMSKPIAAQTLRSAMHQFKEKTTFNSETGEMKSGVNQAYTKDYWLPESDAGSPNIETISGDGPELNDSDQLNFFRKNIYRMSKIPMSRFDQDSGESWFGTDATSYARAEIDFGRYVARLRTVFSEILIKPMLIQLCIDVPEIVGNSEILNSIQLEYKSYNVFENLMEQELMQKSVDFIQSMKDSLVDTDANGNEVKFFSNEMLVRKYLKWSEDDLKLNARLRKQEMNELNEQSEEAAQAANAEEGADEDEY